ncbi:hypothetical protein B0I35DRAFT_476803 [Stachybotrys elegans]|uniref:Dehydrogenase FUB6 n=1 Tax=Stachybotrys elegans TaxID=80388 RepID=A0A8K0SUQ2_9HYPO|nr:hypothetical protein B0I35DRAFT_476803 [Stachybotrys elegans]
MAPNKTLVYNKMPEGIPVPGEHLIVEERTIDLDAAPPAGGLIVEILNASYDPYLRNLMRPGVGKKFYAAMLQPGDPVRNGTISRVLKSDSPDFQPGDIISASLPIAQYAVVPDPQAVRARKLHNPHNLDLGLFLGPLGMPGLTAWAGLHKIGKPKAGETIFISSAAGAVGQCVGAIAKREGLRVVGSVGSDEKLKFITEELGFDAGFNYKKESVFDAVPRLCPDGIDIYWENVGGDHFEAALSNLNHGGRVPLCGMIEDYNLPREKQKGVRGLLAAIYTGATIQGFLVGSPEFGPVYYKEHQEKMQEWLADGSFKAKLDITEGIDKAAEGFSAMFKGENLGKALLKIQ